MEDFFELGKVLKPQGIKGEVKLTAYTDGLDRFSYLEYVFLEEKGEMRRVSVKSARTDGEFAYIALEGFEDRDSAEALRSRVLYVDRESAARLPEGRYYIKDLVGLEIADENGSILGTLAEILQYGSADVYVVKGENGFMFPSIEGVITARDIKAGRITVDSARLAEVCVYDI